MTPIAAQWQRVNGQDRIQGQLSIEMRKQIAAGGRFVFKRRPQFVCIDSDQQQVVPIGEIALGRSPNLRCRRQMDISVRQIYSGTGKDPGRFGCLPGVGRKDLVNCRQWLPLRQ